MLARQDLSKHKQEMTNLLAMVDTYNILLAEDPSIPPTTHPAKNSSIVSVLHNNKWANTFYLASWLTVHCDGTN